MTLPYSKALREQIVKSVTSGISRRTTAQLFDVSIGFVVKLMIRWHSEGTTEPKQMYLRVLAPHADRIKAIVFAQPSLTVDGIHKLLEVEGIRASRVTLFRFLNSIGLTRKRRKALRQGVIKQKKARGSWRRQITRGSCHQCDCGAMQYLERIHALSLVNEPRLTRERIALA